MDTKGKADVVQVDKGSQQGSGKKSDKKKKDKQDKS